MTALKNAIHSLRVYFALGKRQNWCEVFKVREAVFDVAYMVARKLTINGAGVIIAHGGRFFSVDSIISHGGLKFKSKFTVDEFNYQLFEDVATHIEMFVGGDWKLQLEGNNIWVIRTGPTLIAK